MNEKRARDIILGNIGYVWPALALFFSYFIFPDNEWLGAFGLLLLVPIFLFSRLDGAKLLVFGAGVLVLAGYTESNDLAVSAYWLLVSAVICMSVAYLRDWSDGAQRKSKA